MVEAVTATPDNHLIQGIVVLVEDFIAIIEEVIAKEMELGDVDSDVGHLDHVLYLSTVRILDGDVGW